MSVRRNYLYNIAYQVLTLILPLITTPYVSRVLGTDGVGTFSYTFSVAYYFVLFAMFGVNNYGNRSVAMARDDKAELSRTFWGIWTVQAVMCLLCTGIYLVYALFVADDQLLAIVWVPYVLTGALDINWFFFGLEKFRITVLRNFVIKLSTFVLTFAVVRGEWALFNYLLLMSLSYFVSVAVLWPFVRQEVLFVRPGISEVLRHVKPDLVLFIPVIAVSLYTVLDKVMLGQIAGMGETGIFENSLKVAQMPFTLISALGTVMLPHAANLCATGHRESVKRYMAPSMWFAMLLSSAFTFGVIAVSEEFVPIFFGDGFEACSVVMPVIVLEMPFMAWANVIRTQWLMPTSQDRAYVFSVVVGAIANIVVNLALIPALGALGAAIATLVAEAAVSVVQTIAVKGDLPLARWAIESLPAFVIGVLMLAIVRFSVSLLPGGIIGLLLEILVGVFAFGGMSVIWYHGRKNPYLEQVAGSLLKKRA